MYIQNNKVWVQQQITHRHIQTNKGVEKAADANKQWGGVAYTNKQNGWDRSMYEQNKKVWS